MIPVTKGKKVNRKLAAAPALNASTSAILPVLKEVAAPVVETITPVVVAPVAEPAPVAVTEPVVAAKKPVVKSGVRSARIRSAIDDEYLNGAINEKLRPFRAIKKEYKLLEAQLKTTTITAEERAAAIAKINELRGQAEVASREILAYKGSRVRFSANTQKVLTQLTNYVLHELFGFAAGRLGPKDNILHLGHIVCAELRQIGCWPVISTLEVVTAAITAQHVEFQAAKHAKELADARKEAVKAFRTANKIVVPRAPKAAAAATPAAAAPATTPVAAAPVAKPPKFTNPFKTYIGNTWRLHPQNTNKTKLSMEAKDFLAKLVAELAKLIALLIEHDANSQGVKTINGGCVLNAVETLYLIASADRTEELSLVPGEVIDPAALAAEKAKKHADPKYTIAMDKLPRIPGQVVQRTVHYNGGGLNAVRAVLLPLLKAE